MNLLSDLCINQVANNSEFWYAEYSLDHLQGRNLSERKPTLYPDLPYNQLPSHVLGTYLELPYERLPSK